ncbi:MAG: porin family protein, partial [Caulobacterales bacterium]|nr:porin family protein [Caulobacterales bacterium]
MKLKLLAGAALAAAVAASASAASAQDIGWYGAVDLGWHTMEGVEANSTASYKWNFSTEDDWTGFVRGGYRFAPNWRVEAELGYRPGDVDAVRGPTNGTLPTALCTPGVIRTPAAAVCGSPSGSIDSTTLMANLIYDFAPGATLNPFVGIGMGVNRGKFDVVGQFGQVPGTITAANPAIQNVTIDDDDTVFAYQALAGLSWKATEKLNVDVTYRYLDGDEFTFKSVGSAALQPGLFSGSYSDSSLTVGLRYSFAA